MRASVLTMYISPIARADISTISSRTAISVNPLARRFALIANLLNLSHSLVSVAEAHVANADRCRQVNCLKALGTTHAATSGHADDVDLANLIGGLAGGEACIRQIGGCSSSSLIENVISKLQVGDILCHRNGGLSVDLPHEAGWRIVSSIANAVCTGGDIDVICDGQNPGCCRSRS